jgi:sugar (pentulose or hexulose) kinase
MSMAESALVGVDVGTTLIKAVVRSGDLHPLGEAQARTPWIAGPQGIEADPEWLAVVAIGCVMRALSAAGPEVRVRALGVTGMGETGVLVDAQDRPLAPAIAWHDTRTSADPGALGREIPDFGAFAGRPADDRPSLAKWRWLADAGFALDDARRWYSVAEWVAHRLGGSPGSDLSLASRTGALDVRAAEPWGPALEWSGARAGWFGELVPSGAPAGRVAVGPRGLVGAVICVAGLDSYASARALAAEGAETAFLSCGTSGATIRVLDGWPDLARAAAAGFTVDRHLDGRRPVVLGATVCGLVLQPLRDRLGPPDDPAAPEWQRAYADVAEAQSQVIGAMERLCGPTRRVVASGGWIEHPGLEAALRTRVGRGLEPRVDATSAARGAAIVARDAVSA